MRKLLGVLLAATSSTAWAGQVPNPINAPTTAIAPGHPYVVGPNGQQSADGGTATGATASRTLADHFADHIDAADFGVKCDGATDDNTALAAAAASKQAIEIFPQRAPSAISTCLTSHQINFSATGQDVLVRGAQISPFSGFADSYLMKFNGGSQQVDGLQCDGGLLSSIRVGCFVQQGGANVYTGSWTLTHYGTIGLDWESSGAFLGNIQASQYLTTDTIFQNDPTFTGVISNETLTVSAFGGSGTLKVGSPVYGTGVATGTVICALGTGTGGNGTYTICGGPQTVGSEAMTSSNFTATGMYVNSPDSTLANIKNHYNGINMELGCNAGTETILGSHNFNGRGSGGTLRVDPVNDEIDGCAGGTDVWAETYLDHGPIWSWQDNECFNIPIFLMFDARISLTTGAALNIFPNGQVSEPRRLCGSENAATLPADIAAQAVLDTPVAFAVSGSITGDGAGHAVATGVTWGKNVPLPVANQAYVNIVGAGDLNCTKCAVTAVTGNATSGGFTYTLGSGTPSDTQTGWITWAWKDDWSGWENLQLALSQAYTTRYQKDLVLDVYPEGIAYREWIPTGFTQKRCHYFGNTTCAVEEDFTSTGENLTNNFSVSSGKTIGINGDVALSRTGAGFLAVGNGTNGDKSGGITATQFNVYNATGTHNAPLKNGSTTDTQDNAVTILTDNAATFLGPPHWEELTADYTLVSNTSAQPLLNGTASGAFTAAKTGTYEYECHAAVQSLSASSGNVTFSLGGTATFTSSIIGSFTKSAGLLNVTPALDFSTAGSITTAANTNTNAVLDVRGVIRVTAVGTIVPQFTMGVAAAAVVKANLSGCTVRPRDSSATSVSVGNWN